MLKSPNEIAEIIVNDIIVMTSLFIYSQDPELFKIHQHNNPEIALKFEDIPEEMISFVTKDLQYMDEDDLTEIRNRFAITHATQHKIMSKGLGL